MIGRKAVFLGIALIAGTVGLGASASTASAAVGMPAAQPIAGVFALEVQMEPVQYRRWNRGRHGSRYRYRRPGYGYFYRGYWYRSPWWEVRPAPRRAPPRYHDRAQHVSWCFSRYRSYNADSDSFLGYDGNWHRCRSPYSY